ncbi:MAG: PilZ domain-containing protein [Thiotrichales bacterium]|nr:MAG: PilZ domain-containing protein [Thiotrichales bacterium]
MKPNDRNHFRKRLKLDVDVYRLDEHLGICQTRDIDLNGAFIEHCGTRLFPHDLMELQLHVQDGEPGPLCLSATVTRSTDEGLDILFEYGSEEYRRLLNVISTYASDGKALQIPGFWYQGSSVNLANR